MIDTDYKVVTPAYGRDYKSQKEVLEAFLSGKDFILQPQYCYCSIRDFAPGVTVNVRYAKNMKVLPVKVPNK